MTAASAAARRSRTERKRAKRKDGVWDRVGRVHVSPWLIATPVVATVVVIVAVLILTSGSSGTTGGAADTTPDPRVAGLTPEASVSLNVDDINFSNREITGNAGEVIELVVTNTGTISHNLVVAGPDNEYDTKDDFNPEPFAIKAGETGRVVIKIDDPGTYLFRCAFHPEIEFGTVVLK
ncbi:MAG: cupredoxin domain-containing protein [Dehalococcoidia bacterium]